MTFELGKYYRHTTGGALHIIALASTDFYGIAYLAETLHATYQAVGLDAVNADNFHEITREEWYGLLRGDTEKPAPMEGMHGGGGALP